MERSSQEDDWEIKHSIEIQMTSSEFLKVASQYLEEKPSFMDWIATNRVALLGAPRQWSLQCTLACNKLNPLSPPKLLGCIL